MYIEVCQNESIENLDHSYSNSSRSSGESSMVQFPVVCSCGQQTITINHKNYDQNDAISKQTADHFLSMCNKKVDCQPLIRENCSFTYQDLLPWSIFCWEAISTIGYGSKELKTAAGKLFLIPYSMFGIAFVLAILGMTGSMMKSFILRCIGFFERHVLKKGQVCHKEWKVLIATIILTFTSNIIFAYIYSYMTKVDFITSTYFSHVTFSTIGFGDYNMNIVLGRLGLDTLMTLFLWYGMVGTSTLVQAMADIVNRKD